MYFLGLDPGYARLGYGIIKASMNMVQPSVFRYGIIETHPGVSDGKRLVKINHQLNELMNKIKIKYCAVEEIFLRKNLTTGIKLAQVKGVILLVLAQRNISVTSVSPTSVKKMLTGNGAANKKQMQNMIVKILNLKDIPKPDDATDALALSLCSWLRYRSGETMEN